MSLIEQVNAGIMSSMKAKEQDRLRALRGIKSAFLLLKTAEGVSEVTDDMCVKALQKMAKQRKDSLDIYVQQGREDLAVIERAELAVIEAFLPAQMSAEEIETQEETFVLKTDTIKAATTPLLRESGQLQSVPPHSTLWMTNR